MNEAVARTPFALSDAERRRAEEVDRLAALGALGLARLLEMLADASWTVRRSVVASLASLGDAAVGPLCDVLRARRDDEARIAAAVDALVASSADVGPSVLALSYDADPAVVADAAQILGRRRTGSATVRLAELVGHPNENVAIAAIEALGSIGGKAAIDSLARATSSGSFFRTFPAIDVLGRSGDPRAVPPLAQLLDDPRYVLEAARALGRTGDRSAIAPLAALLSRPGDAIVRLAAVALSELRERYGERYGLVEPVDEALRRSAPMPLAPRRLVRGLAGADAAEQAAIAVLLGVLGGEGAPAALAKLLDAPSAVASAAAEALAQLGRSADARIVEALREGSRARRALLLPLVRSQTAKSEVVRCLADPDPEVRAAACDALVRIGDPSAVRPIFALLADPSARVVHAAISAIQALGGDDLESLGLEAAHHARASVRRAALRVLAYFGRASAFPAFVEGLRDPDPLVRDRAVEGLSFVDAPGARNALLTVSRDPSSRTRATAMRALGQCAPEPQVTQRLREGLSDPDAWVRYYACQSLGKLRDAAAAEAVAALLSDEAGHVRVAAVEALSAIGGPVAIPALRRAVEERDPDVRRAALIGLGIAARPESLPTLLEAARSSDSATRLVAVSAIARFSSPEVTVTLAHAARDADESVATAATDLLATRTGADATRALVGLLRQPDVGERAHTALSVAVEGRIDGILEALSGADDELATALTSALARMRHDAATQALLDALELPNAPARKAAATTLAALGTRAAFSALERAAKRDPDPDVRRICALVVAQWA